MKYGYTLFCEGNDPESLIQQAVLAESYGFDFLAISDHFHPWLPNQSNAAFAWAVLGAVAQATTSISLATMVTCPIIRYHPAIVAQMAATMSVISKERFTLGLGAGERLNEHVVGKGWPNVKQRHLMLAEAVDIIKMLWSGSYSNYDGKYFKIDDAKIFNLPKKSIEIFIAGSGASSAKLAASKGAGFCTTDAKNDLIDDYKKQDGSANSVWAQVVLAWRESKSKAGKELYDNFRFSVGGWKVQSELPNPVNFEAATKTVDPSDMEKEAGPDLDIHVQKVQNFIDAGVISLAVAYPGKDHKKFMEVWSNEIKPQLNQ